MFYNKTDWEKLPCIDSPLQQRVQDGTFIYYPHYVEARFRYNSVAEIHITESVFILNEPIDEGVAAEAWYNLSLGKAFSDNIEIALEVVRQQGCPEVLVKPQRVYLGGQNAIFAMVTISLYRDYKDSDGNGYSVCNSSIIRHVANKSSAAFYPENLVSVHVIDIDVSGVALSTSHLEMGEAFSERAPLETLNTLEIMICTRIVHVLDSQANYMQKNSSPQFFCCRHLCQQWL